MLTKGYSHLDGTRESYSSGVDFSDGDDHDGNGIGNDVHHIHINDGDHVHNNDDSDDDDDDDDDDNNGDDNDVASDNHFVEREEGKQRGMSV